MCMNKKSIIAVTVGAVIILLVCIIGFNSCQKKSDNQSVDSQNTTDTENKAGDNSVDKETVPSHEGQARSTLTGLWVDEAVAKKVPTAVMISNVYDALPQSSIGAADIVFESYAEGGITRLCAVFGDTTGLTKIGPVRSCRTYYLFFAKEFEANYVHYGYSDYAKVYLDKPEMHALEGMVYCNFFRSTDRVAPHNAYTSGEGILASVLEKKYPTEYTDSYVAPYTFNEDDSNDISITNGVTCNEFFPGYSNNQPWFTYDPATKLYFRYEFEQAQIDKETGEHLRYKNILVKYVTGSYYENGTPNYITSGTGKGLYITDGNAIEVTWKKPDDYGSTKYYYADGTEIVLNQGKTWVCQIESARESEVTIK